MTSLNEGPSPSASVTAASTLPAAVRPAVSAEVAEEHAVDRWNRQIAAAEQASAANKLRIRIIAVVIVVGAVTWLALTTF